MSESRHSWGSASPGYGLTKRSESSGGHVDKKSREKDLRVQEGGGI